MKTHPLCVVGVMLLLVSVAFGQEIESLNSGVGISLSPALVSSGFEAMEFAVISDVHASYVIIAVNNKLPENAIAVVYGKNDIVLRRMKLDSKALSEAQGYDPIKDKERQVSGPDQIVGYSLRLSYIPSSWIVRVEVVGK